ncbi:helix-turn-helix domain-containing protein [Burkholderiaceae bacterium UC74_6]
MTEAERDGGAPMEEGAFAAESTAAPAATTRPQTAGQWLKAARQQRGLHIAALAALLKVPQSKLEALEADRYQDLPDATFARALAKAVCRTLKVDAGPVMALLPSGQEHELHVSLGINAPYREPGMRSEGLSLQWLSRPVVWGAGLLLLGAVGVYLMPAQWLERATSSAPAASTVTTSASEPVMIAAPLASEPAIAASGPSQASAPQATASAPAPAPQPPVATTSTPSPAPRPAATVPASAANGQLALTLKTTAPSWVEVVDANGQTLISRVVAGGEEEQLSGAAPLKVKIGNVAGTQLLVRGKPMDLLSQAKDNVARLELN